MGRPRKADSMAAIAQGSEAERAPKLADLVAKFKADHPEQWDALRLCPLQHGLEEMERLLG